MSGFMLQIPSLLGERVMRARTRNEGPRDGFGCLRGAERHVTSL